MKTIKLFDTTLRDGEQAPGNSMTINQKVELAKKIDSTNVDYIEAGFPSCSDIDFEATRIISGLNLNAKICVFSRPKRADIERAFASVEPAVDPQLQLLFSASEIHLRKKRRFSIQQALAEVQNGVKIAKNNGFKNIALGCEDAGRGSLELLKQIIDVGVKHGANCVVIADTVGAVLPNEFKNKTEAIRQFIGNDIELSVHCHNDLGLAVSNSFSGVIGGADTIQSTLCGIGERAGNTATEEIEAIISYKGSDYKIRSRLDRLALVDACETLASTIGLSLPAQKPILGKNIFSTAAGIHINGMIQDPECYEFVKPEHYGKKRKFIISRLSGRSVIADRLNEYGLCETPQVVEGMYQKIIKHTAPEQFNKKQNFVELYESVQF